MSSSSMDLAVRPEEQAVHGMEVAERIFTPERRAAISRFLNVADDEPALLPYLATCATYGLDPIMGQIWLIPQRVKIRSRDGSGEQWGERLRPSVGRDGFLAIARRDPRFRGIKFGVVCEHDTFEVDHTEGNPRVKQLPWGFDDLPLVMHRQAPKPTVFEEAVNPARWRGRILGAWAKCYVHGQPPEFFFAPIHEHIRMRERTTWESGSKVTVRDANGRPVLEPDGAWGYVSTMILKAAQSYVLRIAMGITGVVPGDELAGGQLAAIDSAAEPVVEESEFDWDRLEVGQGLAERLASAVAAVNELSPLSWPPAKIEMVMLGRSEGELEDLAERLEGEAGILRARAATEAAPGRPEGPEGVSPSEPDVPAEALSGAQVEEDGPPDAEVVPEESIAALEETQRVLREQLRDPATTQEERDEIQNELDGIASEIAVLKDPNQGRLDT